MTEKNLKIINRISIALIALILTAMFFIILCVRVPDILLKTLGTIVLFSIAAFAVSFLSLHSPKRGSKEEKNIKV